MPRWLWDIVAGPFDAMEGHVTYGFSWRRCVGCYVANDLLVIDINCSPFIE